MKAIDILNYIYDGGKNFLILHFMLFLIILGILSYQNYSASVIFGNEGLLIPICTFYSLMYVILFSILIYSILHIFKKVVHES